jgi:hypothetical protein
MCRRRSVGARVTPSASATSSPCAQVSISRAVTADATLMSGPYHGTRADGSSSANTSSSAAREVPNQDRIAAGRRWQYRSTRASGSTSGAASRSARKRSGVVADATAASSK